MLADYPRHAQHPQQRCCEGPPPAIVSTFNACMAPHLLFALLFALKVSCIARPAEVPDVIAKLSATTFVQVCCGGCSVLWVV